MHILVAYCNYSAAVIALLHTDRYTKLKCCNIVRFLEQL